MDQKLEITAREIRINRHWFLLKKLL